MKKYRILLVVILSLMMVLVGCSSSKDSAPASDVAYSEQAPSEPAPAATSALPEAATHRKIIQRLFYTMETKTFPETLAHILTTMEKNGGYVETMSQTGRGETEDYFSARRVSLVLRLPSKSLDSFTAEFIGDAVVVENRLETEDATEQFFDTEAHLKTLTIQEGRLLKLLDQSVRLEDMIELESRLSQIRYEIESLQGTLNRLSELVNYSVVSIQLDEVKDVLKIKVTKNSYLNRAIEAFMRSLQDLFQFIEELSLWFIGIVPLLIFLAPFVLLYRWIVKRHPQYRILKKREPKETRASASEQKRQNKE